MGKPRNPEILYMAERPRKWFSSTELWEHKKQRTPAELLPQRGDWHMNLVSSRYVQKENRSSKTNRAKRGNPVVFFKYKSVVMSF